jgi:hypothetical protein
MPKLFKVKIGRKRRLRKRPIFGIPEPCGVILPRAVLKARMHSEALIKCFRRKGW